jgi:diguanylate cyclase (GGDEF)-like protein/PAS domain S-box-containing protein
LVYWAISKRERYRACGIAPLSNRGFFLVTASTRLRLLTPLAAALVAVAVMASLAQDRYLSALAALAAATLVIVCGEGLVVWLMRRARLTGHEEFLRLTTDWYWESDARNHLSKIIPSQFLFAVGSTLLADKQITNHRFSHLLGKRGIDCIDTDLYPQVDVAAHVKTLEEQKPFADFVLATRDAKGDPAYFSVSGVPRFGPLRRFAGYRGIAKDVTEILRKDFELAEKRSLVDLLFRLSRDWYWETDAEHRVTQSTRNANIHDFLDTSVGKRRWEIHDKDFPVSWEAHQADLEARRAFSNLVYRRKGADGAPRFVRVSGEPRYTDGGEFLGYRGIAQEVTDVLAHTEQRNLLSQIFDHVPFGIVHLDHNQRIITINKKLMEYRLATGYMPEGEKPGALKGRAVLDLLLVPNPAERQALQTAISTATRNVPNLARVSMGDGEDQLVLDIFTIPDGNRGAQGTQGVILCAQDVTVSEKTIVEVKRATYTLEAVLNSAPVPLYIRDKERRITRWNKKAEELFGFSAAEMVGSSQVLAFKEEGDELIPLPPAIGSPSPPGGTRAIGVKKNGNRFVAVWFIAPVRVADGDVAGNVVSVVDQTAQEHSQAEIKRISAELTTLFAQAPVGILQWNTDERIVEVNPEAEKILGYSRESLLGVTVDAAIDMQILDRRHLELRAGERSTFEVTRRRKDGTHIITQGALAKIRAKDGDPMGSLLVFSDVTEMHTQRERLNRLMATPTVAFVLHKPSGEILLWNPGAEHILGFSASEVLGKSIDAILARASDASPAPSIDEIVAHKSIHAPTSVIAKDGKIRHLSAVYSSLYVHEELDSVALILIDETQEHVERERGSLFLRIFNDTSDSIILADADMRVIQVNHACTVLTGYSEDELRSHELWKLFDSYESTQRYSQKIQDEGEHYVRLGNIGLRRKNGDTFVASVTASIIRDTSGKPTHISTVLHPPEVEETDQLQQSATLIDPVTQLPAKPVFMDRVGQLILRSQASKERVGLLYLNIDGFRSIRDDLGMQAAEALLCEVGTVFRTAAPRDGTVAHLGGDRFAVLLAANEDPLSAALLALRIKNTFQSGLSVGGQGFFASASIGIAFFPDDAHNAEDLLMSADRACWRAKEQGGDVYEFENAQFQGHRLEGELISQNLEPALRGDELRLTYQPVLLCKDGSLHSLEALVRWHHPQLGVLLPARFLPVAERSGIASAIDAFVASALANDARRLIERQRRPLFISHNLSEASFRKTTLGQDMFRVFMPLQISLNLVGIEIGEHLVAKDIDYAVTATKALRDLGFIIIIDNVSGTRLPVAALRRIAPDFLKLDVSLVAPAGSERWDLTILKGLIAECQALGIPVIAKGLERPEQLPLIQELGCYAVQSKAFLAPMDIESLSGKLSEKDLFQIGQNRLQQAG